MLNIKILKHLSLHNFVFDHQYCFDKRPLYLWCDFSYRVSFFRDFCENSSVVLDILKILIEPGMKLWFPNYPSVVSIFLHVSSSFFLLKKGCPSQKNRWGPLKCRSQKRCQTDHPQQKHKCLESSLLSCLPYGQITSPDWTCWVWPREWWLAGLLWGPPEGSCLGWLSVQSEAPPPDPWLDSLRHAWWWPQHTCKLITAAGIMVE